MKLPEHVNELRDLIEAAFDKYFARLGIGKNKQLDIEKLPEEVRPKRLGFEEMLENHIGETGDYEHAREKLIDELTFTLFNRLAAVKVMEAAALMYWNFIPARSSSQEARSVHLIIWTKHSTPYFLWDSTLWPELKPLRSVIPIPQRPLSIIS